MTPRLGSPQPKADVPDVTKPESSRGRTMRADIQALRAAAVAAVVVFHLAPGVLPGGFVGVDVFFVVSGYLVGGALAHQALKQRAINLWQFFARRARRIAPLSAVVATVTIIWSAFVMSPLDLTLWGPPPLAPTVTRDGLASVLGIPNLWMGVSGQGYLVDVYPSPFTHYWSLGVEEQFYLIAPFLLLLLFVKVKQYRVGVLVLVAMTVASFDLAISGWTLGTLEPFFNPLTRAWELGAGVLAALVAKPVVSRFAARGLATPIVIAAWVGLGIVGATVSGIFGWPRPAALVPVLCTVAILVVGTVRPAGRVARFGALRWAGDRSYSIYLWHWPFVVLLLPVLPWPDPVGAAMVIACTLLASWVSYRWIEKPMRRMPVDSPIRARNTILASGGFIGVAFVAVLLVGIQASTSDLAGKLHAPPYIATPASTQGQTFERVVPLNLRPSLTGVAQDFSLADSDGCNVATGRPDLAVPTECIYGTKGPLIALFGDSHALQWLEALLPGAQSGEHRVALVTANGCPPLPSVLVTDRESCETWQPLALARVVALEPDLVLMSASTTQLAWDGTAGPATAKSDVGELAQALADLNVAWIADTPQLPWLPDRCAADDVNDISGCITPRSEALAGSARSILEQEAKANGWAWLDLNDYLCDAQVCGIILGDAFLYRDDDHITATFSTELAAPLGALVAPLLAD